ncbi:MAG: GntR family transcriptional regulator [Marinibacterium sp.]|nr:GntR family transcriptional regulator [Marinibacterium sp.]
MNTQDPKRPEHQTIYLQVRDRILFGDFVPGQPVTIHGLAEVIGAGVTPIREAIRRLTSEGALEALENRRVAVPEMTRDRLTQIHLVRRTVEPALAELAARLITPAQIHLLESIDAELDAAIAQGDAHGYLEANHRFHFTLYGLAGAEVLQRIADSLWLQMGPSLRVVCGRSGTDNLVDNHKAATRGLRAGSPEDVRAAIEADLDQGLDFILRSLPDC